MYVEATQTFYILDLLAWAGIHYWETEAEFRFFCASQRWGRSGRFCVCVFWVCVCASNANAHTGIQQKLAETTATQRSALNSYVFCALPIAPATRQAIVAAAQVRHANRWHKHTRPLTQHARKQA